MKSKRHFCIKRKRKIRFRLCCKEKVKKLNNHYYWHNYRMVWDQQQQSAPKFSTSFANRCIFSDVAGDITIFIDGESFLLHKFPLVSRSAKIRKLVSDPKNATPLSKLELADFPGGPETFELAAKFCYGMNFEITTTNVAPLRCAAEYLEMTEDYQDENLVERTQTYLTRVVSQSLEKSVEVLSSCECLLPLADEIGIPERCISAIARCACNEQLVSGSLEWWVEDLSNLGIDFYRRVITAMGKGGVPTDSMVASVMHYAQASLKGIGTPHIWNPARTSHGKNEKGQRAIVESLVTLLPTEKSSCCIPMSFLFGMTRVAIMVDATLATRLELERRIGCRLEMALLDDLLIPSSTHTGNSLFDVDTIHRILVQFLQRIEEEESDDDDECGGYESEGMGSSGHGSLLKVGRLIDAYLAEIAPDPYLNLAKFVTMIEVLPDYARVIDDGLYRAIDIYLKAHPTLNEQECKRLCMLVDCEKLSQEACNHAAQNDRLPVHMVVRVLYFEQVRLKNAMSGSWGDGLLSQKMMMSSSSAPMSPRDTYASLRRENRELKLEISRMRVRLSDLEKEQVVIKQGMMDKSLRQGKTLFTSISRRIGMFKGHEHQHDVVKPAKTGKTRSKRG